MTARSIIEKTRHRFNAAVAEVDTQDMHQTLTIGVAVVSGEHAHASNMMDEIIRFKEENTDAQLLSITNIRGSIQYSLKYFMNFV